MKLEWQEYKRFIQEKENINLSLLECRVPFYQRALSLTFFHLFQIDNPRCHKWKLCRASWPQNAIGASGDGSLPSQMLHPIYTHHPAEKNPPTLHNTSHKGKATIYIGGIHVFMSSLRYICRWNQHLINAIIIWSCGRDILYIYMKQYPDILDIKCRFMKNESYNNRDSNIWDYKIVGDLEYFRLCLE